ncbi:MAG: methyltransferase [Rhizomicrobium sp.]
MKLKALATVACIVVSGAMTTASLAAPPPTVGGSWADGALATAVRSITRSPQFVARDQYRHPRESLSFWGLRPGMTILEIWPSGGYWTEILAPYAKATNGRYIAAVASADHPLNARFNNTALYGTISTTVFNEKSPPLTAPGTVDFLLTARNIHDWPATQGMTEKAFADFYAALKPGGILAVEEHRSDPRPMVKDASDGYMSTASVVKLAQDAGFKLEAQSEINANPKDTKDHPFGVWTLPPTRQSAPEGQPANPKFDHAKYDAIGESDRMTLRFRKPG